MVTKTNNNALSSFPFGRFAPKNIFCLLNCSKTAQKRTQPRTLAVAFINKQGKYEFAALDTTLANCFNIGYRMCVVYVCAPCIFRTAHCNPLDRACRNGILVKSCIHLPNNTCSVTTIIIDVSIDVAIVWWSFISKPAGPIVLARAP